MFKKSQLLLAIVLAVLLCFAGLSAALAAGLNEKGGLEAANENDPIKAAATKILEVPVGTDVPSAVFQFAFTPIKVDDEPYDSQMPNMPSLDDVTVNFSDSATAITPTGDVERYYMESGNIFSGVTKSTFPHDGIYVYEFTEIENTNTDIDANIHKHTTLTYSGAKYTLAIYVAYTEDGSGTYIYGLGTYLPTEEAADITSEEGKTDPTPGGNDEGYFYSQMIFINQYVKTNGADAPDDPEPASESTLSVSKTVTGSSGNQDEYFKFSIELTVPSLVKDIPNFYRAYVVKDGEVVTSTSNADSSLIDADDTENAYSYIEISTSGPTAFQLQHGQSLVFVNTPVGTGYDVSESASDHIPSVIVTTGGSAASKVEGKVATDLKVTGQRVGESNNTNKINSADFTNFRNLITPVGLSMNDLPFVVLTGLALTALIVFIAVKSHKRKATDA